MGERCEIGLLWVPAHIGMEHNKRVDGMAKEATVSTPQDGLRISVGDVGAGVRVTLLEATQPTVQARETWFGIKYFDEFYKAKIRQS